ncbi:MAG: efflux RND transporter periplasmic adaptor subunit [Chromatiales bacterium]|jgi:RND family efflux transporter MFP subunit
MNFKNHHSLSFLLLFASLLPWSAMAELQTAVAQLQESPREFLLDGTVEAIQQTTVSAQTSGQVEAVLFDVDDFVEKGQVLIRLKETEQKARLNQSEADLKEAVARLQEAEDEYKRTSDLFGKKLVSKSQMDKATAALKAARARQEAASAGLIQASEQFEYTRIKAPYSGIVTERHVQVGEIASPGQKLMSGLSLDQLRVLVDVPQSLIPTIRKLQQAKILLPDGEVIDATRLTIFPYAHERSNTFKVRVDLPQGITDLFPGMFVKIAFLTGVKQQLVVPRSAVVYRSEVTAVYVVDEQERVHFRRIRAGKPTGNDMLAVIAGLAKGEKVALDPISAGAELKRQLAEVAHE